MNQKSKKIVAALQDAKTGQQVYDALNEVPTENLEDMHDMIMHILHLRKH